MSTPQNELLANFLHIATVDGVSHRERAIADEVIALLRRGGIRVVEDQAAGTVRGNTGNLLCFPRAFDERSPAIVLEAHLDTVLPTSHLKTVVADDRVTSDGSTILGADNRMGLSILLELLLRSARAPQGDCGNFFVVLTVCEETGLLGAQALDLSGFRISAVYVFDCSRRPGVYIRDSVGLSTFRAEFLGKSAHAGVAPEEGVNAIALCATGISKLRLGRIDPETTVNIGRIRGGEAINVVPDKVTIEGEVRSFEPERIKRELRLIQNTLEESVSGRGKVLFDSEKNFDPYSHASGAPAVVFLEEAVNAVGLRPQPIRYMGGSDANVFNARGIPAVNVGIGAQKPHSTEEFFLLEDLYISFELAVSLTRSPKQPNKKG